MPDWLIAYLGTLHGGIGRTLAVEMQAGVLALHGWPLGLVRSAPCAPATARPSLI